MRSIKSVAVFAALTLSLSACGQAGGDSEGPIAFNPDAVGSSAVENSATYELDANVQMLTAAALKSRVAYDAVTSLTTEVGPRLAGTPAEARARDWGAAKFKALGFENIQTHPFTISGWERGVETAHIITPFPQPLYITALGGSVATPKGGIEADVAYFPTYDDLINSPEGGLDGKIVYISGLMEKAHDGAGYGPANRKRRSGATQAAKRGALAVIIRSVGTDSHRFPHTGQMAYAIDGTQKIPIAALSAPDADQLDRIFESGKSVRIALELTPSPTGEQPSGNVMAEIIGSEKPEEIIVIGAHLDSWDLGTGAVDDGAGIGIVLGAAKTLMESGLKPKRTIRVIMFGAEEVGLLGARIYAHDNQDALHTHMIATESDFGAGPVYEVRPGVGKDNKASPASLAFAQKLQQQIAHLDIAMGSTPSNGGPDIGPMVSFGVPTLRLQQNGYDYFDLHHTPDDTLDKIDPDQLAQNVAAYAAFLWMASEAETDFRDDQ